LYFQAAKSVKVNALHIHGTHVPVEEPGCEGEQRQRLPISFHLLISPVEYGDGCRRAVKSLSLLGFAQAKAAMRHNRRREPAS
jgi:hypothetical protein